MERYRVPTVIAACLGNRSWHKSSGRNRVLACHYD
jgi:hypothetical protein